MVRLLKRWYSARHFWYDEGKALRGRIAAQERSYRPDRTKPGERRRYYLRAVGWRA